MNNNRYFEECIIESHKCLKYADVPIGAIIVKNDKIIGRGFNTREKDNNILGHAEINAILEASKSLNNWNLSDCDLYVSLQPCSMCNEVIKQSRIRNVYYLLGKLSFKKEYNRTIFHEFQENDTFYIKQMYAKELSDFFKEKRQ